VTILYPTPEYQNKSMSKQNGHAGFGQSQAQ